MPSPKDFNEAMTVWLDKIYAMPQFQELSIKDKREALTYGVANQLGEKHPLLHEALFLCARYEIQHREDDVCKTQ